MRSPSEFSTARTPRPRRRIIIIVVVVLFVVLAVSIRSLAGLYTDSLWYSSINQHEVFSTMLEVKFGLFLTFGLIFFFAMWTNLLLCNRLGPSELFLNAPEDELVRRFQGAVRPYAGRLYALLSIVLALIAASSAVGKWGNYLLFANSKNFGITDPLFHKDFGFYVFQLPFLTFLVDWVLASLVAIIVFTVIFHYLNGGIRAARVTPRVSPGVKVHLSVLIALLAVAKAAGYLVAKWHMVTSTTNGVVEGAGYADVHARIPALTLLFWLCLAAAVILLINIRQRGWTLPIIAVGLWAFVALAIGVIYPSVLQALKVTPAQSSLEQPYIARNISATRAAYSINDVSVEQFAPTSSKPPLSQPAVTESLADIRQWDPVSLISQSTYQQVQALRNYYSFSQIGEDRYVIDGKLTPVNVGVRELNSVGLQNPTWVNTHLQFTHGLGIVVSPSNEVQQQTGQPNFDVGNVPPVSSGGFPTVTKPGPGIYFGLNQSGFVVADTKQPELNYEAQGVPHYQRYTGKGGIQMGGLFRRAMFAIRFGDPNLFLSNLITPTSRIIFVRNVVQIAQRAAPFLSIDAHPYAVLIDGQINWVLDGYTTTDQYPYSQNANTQLVPGDNGLPGSYNYVRNSVKIIVNAYTGQVTLYDMLPSGPKGIFSTTSSDPILNAWMSAFPGLVKPLGQMGPELRAHLKYPEDIFSIQAAIFGRYHINNPQAFYSNGDGWSITPTDGAGPPSNTIKLATQYDKQGYILSQTAARMDPLYQIYAVPGSSKPQYTLTDAYVTASAANSTGSASGTAILNLTAFMVALSDPSDYGQLHVYRPPHGGTTIGPVQADSKMSSFPPASTRISLLHQAGSKVLLGNVLMIPINGSMLYVRPLYVTATSVNFPLLKYVIAVYGNQTGFSPTMEGALGQVFGLPQQNSGGSTHGLTANQLLKLAQLWFGRAETALTAQQLGTYQHDTSLGILYVTKAEALLSAHK